MTHCCDITAVKTALNRIRPFIHRTPMMTSQTLDKLAKHKIFMKAENFQVSTKKGQCCADLVVNDPIAHILFVLCNGVDWEKKTGSFKFRGALNAVLRLNAGTRAVVTDSSGNYGQALACAALQSGLDCYVVMPHNSAKCKIESVRSYGANVIFCEPSESDRRDAAEKTRTKHDAVYLSASQHPDVIAGNGTMGLEILEQEPDVEVVVAAVGGGGMIAGIATAIKAIKPGMKIIAAEPEIANDCSVSKKCGILTPNRSFPATIADGVRVSVGTNTWPIIRDLVDDVITVSESEIKSATLLAMERCKVVIEPTAGVVIAAVLTEEFDRCLRRLFGDGARRNVAIVLCGGNLDFSAFSKLLE